MLDFDIPVNTHISEGVKPVLISIHTVYSCGLTISSILINRSSLTNKAFNRFISSAVIAVKSFFAWRFSNFIIGSLAYLLDGSTAVINFSYFCFSAYSRSICESFSFIRLLKCSFCLSPIIYIAHHALSQVLECFACRFRHFLFAS